MPYSQNQEDELLATLLEKELKLQLEITDTRMEIDRLREERVKRLERGRERGPVGERERESVGMDRRREEFKRECEDFSRGLVLVS